MKPKITALLTGRGNNTLTDKNIASVLGRPLLQWTAMAARRCDLIDDFYASSDCDRILRTAEAVGYTPIKRPEHLSRPDSQHRDVLVHALETMRAYGSVPDILVVQLANVATIKTEWINACIQSLLEDTTATAVVPCHRQMDNHPFRAKRVTGGYLNSFFDFTGMKISSNRQDLEPCFFLDHSIWVLRLKNGCLNDENGQPPWTFMGARVIPFATEGCFDVHDRSDLYKSEEWLRENRIPAELPELPSAF